MSIKQRLYPEPGHRAGLVEHCHQARFVFNLGLEQRAMWRRDKHARGDLSAAKITTATQMRELAQLRQSVDWVRAGSSSVQQAALRDLDRAFQNFYAGRACYPQFKRRSEREGSFVVRDLTVRRLNRGWGLVTVPKVGQVRFRISRTWGDIEQASSARVTHRNGRWHISFTTPASSKIIAGTGVMVGIDRGVANTVALSDHTMRQIPSLTAGEQVRFLALEQRLARQTRAAKRAGRSLVESRNRGKTLDQLAVLRRGLEDRRTNWVEKSTTMIAKTHDVVVVEGLKITNMVRKPTPKPDPEQPGRFLSNRARAKAKLNKAIYASCWGRLDHKTLLVKVSPYYTSQTCRACGHVAPANRESQAVFRCLACRHVGHADTNAAQNILAMGEQAALNLLRKREHETQPTGSGGSPASDTTVSAVQQEPDGGASRPEPTRHEVAA